MIQLDIGQLVALMGIPSAITGLCFWMIQRQLSKSCLLYTSPSPRDS